MKINPPRVLVILGLVLMLIGAIDPLEGSVVILAGTLLVAIGAYVSRNHEYRLQVTALILTAAGIAAMFWLSSLGGVGGRTGRSAWWLLVCLPYPIGWLLGLWGAARTLREPKAAA